LVSLLLGPQEPIVSMKRRGHLVGLMVDTEVAQPVGPPFTEACNYYWGYGKLGLQPLLRI
jgi:hypothetical protein